MNSMKSLGGSIAVMLVGGGASLFGQQLTGNLSGQVSDLKGKPLAGVLVVLESKALFQPQQVKTNAKGEWRAPLLPVGDYTLKVSKAGYLGKTVTSTRVGVATSPRVDLQLKPMEEAGTTVAVVDMAQVTSKAEVQTSVNFSGEQISQLPYAASASTVFDIVQDMAPGYIANQGIRGGGDSGTSFLVDGIDVKDSAINSPMFAPLPDNVEDVQMVQSMVNARNGRVSGGQVKVLTKTGGNEFAGSIRAYYSRTSWTANPFGATAGENAAGTPDNATRNYDITVSGPIWKDHIWFNFGTRLQPTDTATTFLYGPFFPGPNTPLYPNPNLPGQYNPAWEANFPQVQQILTNGPGNGYTPVPLMDANTYVSGQEHNHKYEGKITVALAASHILTLSGLEEQSTYLGYADSIASQLRYNQDFYGPSQSTRKASTLNYHGVLTPTLLVEVNLFFASSSQLAFPGPTNVPTSVYAGFNNSFFGMYLPSGPIPILRESSSTTPETHTTGSQSINFQTFQDLYGSHEIDFGFENVRLGYNSGAPSGAAADRVLVGGWYQNSAGNFLFPTIQFMGPNINSQNAGPYLNGLSPYGQIAMGPAPVLMQTWVKPGENLDYTRAVYVNDNWTVNKHLSANLGLRYSRFYIYDIDGSNLASYAFFEPRFQAKWDPAGNGKNVFDVVLARYAQEFTTSLSRSFITDPQGVYTLSGWKGLPGQLQPGNPADPNYGVSFVDYNTLVNPANYGTPYSITDVRQVQQLQNLKVPYCDELSLNYRKSFTTGSVGLSLAQRKFERDITTLMDFGFPNFNLVTDPSGQGGPSIWEQRRTFTNSPDARLFQTVEFSWQENITHSLEWGGSITYHQITGPLGAWGDYPSLRSNPIYGVAPQDQDPSGLQARGQKMRAYWTYHHRIGKGEVTFTLLANYDEGAANGSYLQGLSVLTPFTDPSTGQPLTMPSTGPGGFAVQPVTPFYAKTIVPYGEFKMVQDLYSVSLKTGWTIPLGIGNAVFLGSIAVSGVLNNAARSNDPYFGTQLNFYDPGAVAGRYMLGFAAQPGTYPNAGTPMAASDYNVNSIRRVTEFTAGFRF